MPRVGSGCQVMAELGRTFFESLTASRKQLAVMGNARLPSLQAPLRPRVVVVCLRPA